MSAYPFEKAVVFLDGETKEFEPEQFMALPLTERIRFMLQQRVTFYGQGRELDRQDVLMRMRGTAVKTARLTSVL